MPLAWVFAVVLGYENAVFKLFCKVHFKIPKSEITKIFCKVVNKDQLFGLRMHSY